MTPVNLLDALEEYVKAKTQDIVLQVRNKEKEVRRPPDVYKMRLPDKESETKLIPYVLLQLVTGRDLQEDGKPSDSVCKVRIVVATYSDDAGVGAYDVLNVITQLRTNLLKERVVAKQYMLRIDPTNALEYVVYSDDTAPYYLGEMMTTWEMPEVEREVREIWHR